MSYVLGLRCVLCGAEYGPGEVTYVCPKHGHEGILDVVYDYAAIGRHLTRKSLAGRRQPSIWRYQELLPIERPELVPPLEVGWTPLYRAQRLGERWAWGNCGSRTMAATPPPRSRTGPAPSE